MAFHYLSKKPVRKPNDQAMLHEGLIEQARSDINRILLHRINELVPGGILTCIVAGRSATPNINYGMLIYNSYLRLVEKGIITVEVLKTMEWNLYTMTIGEWNEVLNQISDKVEVLHLEITQDVYPYYTQFLRDRDFERYKDNLVRDVAILCKLNLFDMLSHESDGEKERIYGLFREELRNGITETAEIFWDITTLVLKKK